MNFHFPEGGNFRFVSPATLRLRNCACYFLQYSIVPWRALRFSVPTSAGATIVASRSGAVKRRDGIRGASPDSIPSAPSDPGPGDTVRRPPRAASEPWRRRSDRPSSRRARAQKNGRATGVNFHFPEGGNFRSCDPARLAAPESLRLLPPVLDHPLTRPSVREERATGWSFHFPEGGNFRLIATRFALRPPGSRRLLPPVLDRPLTRPSKLVPFSLGTAIVASGSGDCQER